MKKQLRNDLILISSVLVVAFSVFMILKFTAKSGNHVKVNLNGKNVAVYPLEKNAEHKIKTDYGYNLLVIKDGSAYIADADCRDKICQHHRAIKKEGESIICLPHKLVVTVEGD